LDGRTSGNSVASARNPRAVGSVLVGVLSLLVIPGGIYAARELEAVTLINSSGTVALAMVLGLAAVVLARRGRERAAITLGRAGGEQAARIGRLLGILGICVGITGALALGFYALLTLFAD
jgi:hypothetical protein